MSNDFVRAARDTRGVAIDICNDIDKRELRESYLEHVLQPGI
jgi:hypothetical protein